MLMIIMKDFAGRVAVLSCSICLLIYLQQTLGTGTCT